MRGRVTRDTRVPAQRHAREWPAAGSPGPSACVHQSPLKLILPQPLALRAHLARFGFLRQHSFREIKTLLRLAELLLQGGHISFEGFETGPLVARIEPPLPEAIGSQ